MFLQIFMQKDVKHMQYAFGLCQNEAWSFSY